VSSGVDPSWTVELVEDRVVDATPGFALSRALQARQVLLATGAADDLPDVAGARERWGRDFRHCPYCRPATDRSACSAPALARSSTPTGCANGATT
jgi:thioredoxin reductase